MTSQEKDKILTLTLCFLDDAHERRRIDGSSSRIEKDFAGRGMAREKIESRGIDLAHLAFRIAAAAFQELCRDRVRVRIASLADVIDEYFHFDSPSTAKCPVANDIRTGYCFKCEESMASTVWKGYITFGLITIPVRLFAAARTERVSFNQIHQVCGSRIKQQTFCPHCDRVIERSELVKGYEVEKDRYVIVNDEEIKSIAPASSDNMEILEFVKAEGIDPIYFDSSFFMVPEDAGKKAYHLLLETMRKSGYSAVAKITMHQREYTVIVRPNPDGLLLHTMFYPEEVREVPEFRRDESVTVKPQEVALAEKLVEGLASDFDPSKYHDEYQGRLMQMVEAKREGQSVPSTAPKHRAPVIDLMQALQKSLGELPRKPAAKAAQNEQEAAPAKKAPAKRRSATG